MNEADAAHWKILCAGSLQLRKQQIMGASQKQCEFCRQLYTIGIFSQEITICNTIVVRLCANYTVFFFFLVSLLYAKRLKCC